MPIQPETNFTSITPANDLNDVHHIPGTGVMLLANEGIRMTTYFVPQLGPAPKWCSFLENLTEEMEDQTTRTAYQDYKFIDRNELAKYVSPGPFSQIPDPSSLVPPSSY